MFVLELVVQYLPYVEHCTVEPLGVHHRFM